MRMHAIVMMTVMALGIGCWGCAGSSDTTEVKNKSIAMMKPAKGHPKKVAIVLTRWPQTEFGRRIGDLYLNTIISAMRDEDSQLRLVSAQDPEFPDFLSVLPQSSKALDPLALARDGRRAGFNGIVTASIENVRPESKKTGLFWFRKMRYFLYFDLIFDLYDPITGAKIINQVEEASVKISEDDFESLRSGTTTGIEKLDNEIVDLGEDLGEQAAETLADQPWQTIVVKVQGTRVFLAAGNQAGLHTGARLAVFKGRSILEGQGGEKFTVPGLKIGEIVITEVNPQMAEAKAENPDAIQAGDIVVPVE